MLLRAEGEDDCCGDDWPVDVAEEEEEGEEGEEEGGGEVMRVEADIRIRKVNKSMGFIWKFYDLTSTMEE